ncbi:FAD:protein FMN transferase [Bizionia sp. KMM 8389]
MKPLSILIVLLLLTSCTQTSTNSKFAGQVFGTSYSVIYDSDINYQTQFDSIFKVINKSLSTYIPDSDISKVNRNESTTIDNHFINVFNTSTEIYTATEGVFDPTIGAVVNAWDFGPKGKIVGLDSLKIDSLMQSVGFNKVAISTRSVQKTNPNTFLDFNAIAKGYGVDVIGEFLESKNIKNYLVEIGGEIRTRGINKEKDDQWTVGVEMPHFDGEQSVLKAIHLQNQSMATSGTYRKFKLDSLGNKFAHIINTKTGYPSKTNILSVSVITEDCMTADAYATAFQAMGIEKVQDFVKDHSELKVFLIFENDNNEFETMSLNNFPTD